MADWWYQWPSTTVKWKLEGTNAKRLQGEATKLLFQLKGMMKTGNVTQMRALRIFDNGSQIIARSSFGMDFLTIKSVDSESRCSIILLNLPAEIPPHLNAGQILDTEVVNVDYIKTYYILDTSKCPTCSPLDTQFLFTYETPVESRHYDDEPLNHCIYSEGPPCWGELLLKGNDGQGDYFLWKAYTEAAADKASGLGVMSLRGYSTGFGALCEYLQKIDVDCCLKAGDKRVVEIWWSHGCEFCIMPTSVDFSELIHYVNWEEGILYATPGCIPLDWKNTGPGLVTVLDPPNNTMAIWGSPEGLPQCNEPGAITLTDRCGTHYDVNLQPCCASQSPPVIIYTTLQMSCLEAQTLGVEWGCPPYTWSLSGGGYLDGTTYYAPASNENCEYNPTITVQDCCGNSASIDIAVNCYFGGGTAMFLWHWESLECTFEEHEPLCNDLPRIYGLGFLIGYNYDCDGNLMDECGMYVGFDYCNVDFDCASLEVTVIGGCNWGAVTPPYEVMRDQRSPEVKAAGCCPLNPLTGLPF